ncbi:hypothetical protein GOBAR_DD09128 [Gossypium barbadense]|nr:hypothetical protein GOBAR_DD09128 [Gossypium barbadense]
MFIAGIIKYSERIWALYRASTDSFRKYLLQDKDPGPDYALLMDKFACMRDGHLPTKTITVEQPEKEDKDVKLGKLSDLEVLHYAYHFFETFKGLVVDLVFSRHARKENRDFFKVREPEDALRVIEVELNFLYGVFYTKMMIMHSSTVKKRRPRSSGSLSVINRVLQTTDSDSVSAKNDAALSDSPELTDLPNGGAFQRIHAWREFKYGENKESAEDAKSGAEVGVLSTDSMTKLGESEMQKKGQKVEVEMVHPWPEWIELMERLVQQNYFDHKRRDDEKMVEDLGFDMTNVVEEVKDDAGIDFKDYKTVQTACINSGKDRFNTLFLMLFFSDWTFASPVHPALKPLALIYRCCLALTNSSWHLIPENEIQVLRTPLFRRWSGSVSGHNFVRYCRKSSPTTMLKFTSWWDLIPKVVPGRALIANLVGKLKLILWPLSFVSKLCYIPETIAEKMGIKEFLDEMAYVSHEPLAKVLWDLVFQEIKEKSEEALISQNVAKRISSGLAKIRFQDTLAEAERLFARYPLGARNSDKGACEIIYGVNTDVKPVYLKGDRSKSVLFDACRLAKELNKFGNRKRVLISKVWVELLSYAATQCRPSAHVEQIGKGGELITFVWLLVAHFGLGHCFQTTTVAKLIAGKKVSLVRKWGPIKDITSPRMTQLAEFAKSDYNKVLSPSGLKLRRVMTDEMKVVHGVKYKLDCNKIVCPMPIAMVLQINWLREIMTLSCKSQNKFYTCSIAHFSPMPCEHQPCWNSGRGYSDT